MPEYFAVRCSECGQVYSARKHDGRFLLSTRDGQCSCGGAAFEAVAGEASEA